MKKGKVLFLGALLLSESALAGGILTNTNQSVSFLRNPARDGAIGIDGVYFNPAGVAFMNEGFHLSLNWQSVWQTRKIDTTNPLFLMNVNNPNFGKYDVNNLNGVPESAYTTHYEGKANAPVFPSIQAAYNKDKWSFQFNFSVTGGGGKCEFDKGLGSFEGAVGQIAGGLRKFGATVAQENPAFAPMIVQGYDANYFMRGKQFYFGFQLGTAYKVTDNFSVYSGLRALYGTASYKAKISDIAVRTSGGMVPFNQYYSSVKPYIEGALAKANAGLEKQEPVKDNPAYADMYKATAETQAQLEQLNGLGVYSNGVNLQADQTGFGIAPVIGVDYKVGNFNFAAKYEFRVKMSMKNESTLKEAMAIDAVNQFRDGTSVREDSPTLLTLGAQWEAMPNLRLNAGYHHFFDKESKKYGNKQELLSGGANEYLGGIEYDATKKLTVSSGFQITRYGLTDAYMSDLSFVVDSWSFGLGAKYQINDKVAVNAAYFQTNYGNYKTAVNTAGIKNDFTRTNKVVGVGVDLAF